MSNVKISEEIYEDKDSNDGTKRTESIMEVYITRYDHLSTIECRAINPAMNEPIKATIQFKVLCKFFFTFLAFLFLNGGQKISRFLP